MTYLRKADEYLNLEQACRLLKVSYRGLKRMIAAGKIPCRQLGERTYRISRIELDQWIRNRNYPTRHQPENAEAPDECRRS